MLLTHPFLWCIYFWKNILFWGILSFFTIFFIKILFLLFPFIVENTFAYHSHHLQLVCIHFFIIFLRVTKAERERERAENKVLKDFVDFIDFVVSFFYIERYHTFQMEVNVLWENNQRIIRKLSHVLSLYIFVDVKIHVWNIYYIHG